MAVGVADALLGSQRCPALCLYGVGADAGADVLGIARVVGDIALFGDVKYGALDTVADHVVEEGDSAAQLLRVLLDALIVLGAGAGGGRIGGGAACPALAPNGDPRIDLVELLADHVHGLGVDQTHQVKAEAVDVILVCPVQDGVNHILSGHGALGGDLVAAAGAVGEGAGLGQSVVIIGNGRLEAGIVLGVGIGVVVNNVHNDGDTGVVQRLDHRLALFDPHVAIVGIRGEGAFGNVVVLRIVAPVELGVGACLVDGLEVIEGVELNGGNAELLQIVDTGSELTLTVERGALLGKGEIFAAVCCADAGSGVP